MVTCKQSTEWVVKSEHGELSQKQKSQLKAHLDDCPYCRLFADQSGIITKAFQKNEAMSSNVLSEEEKKELTRAIENKIAKP